MLRLRQIATAILTLALLAGSFAFGGGKALAQSGRDTTAAPGTWGSAILIQNIGTGSAQVEVKFYDAQGVERKTYNPGTIDAGKSVTIVVFRDANFSDLAGQYSAVVSSTQPVVASVQTSSTSQTSGPWTAFAYEGVDTSDTANKLFFPGNYRNYFGFNSEIVIQNAGPDTTLTAEFYDAAGTKIGQTINLGTLGANRARTWAMSDAVFSALPSGNTGLFGAVINSSAGPIAGIANIWATAPTNKTASYNAFTTGSNTFYAPSLSRNYFGFISALTIQNVGDTDAAVTVTYSNNSTEQFTLKPNAARAVLQEIDNDLPAGNTNGSFSATVTTVGGSIVGLVSYSRPANLNNGAALGDFASYNCPPVAATSVNVPNVLSNYFGYFTNVTIQNAGNATADITLTYENGLSWTVPNVPANGVANFLHLNPGGAINNPLGNRASVSATATSTEELVVVIQHNTASQVSGYDASKVPSDYLMAFTGTPK
jgi:hypothetical protein